MDPQTVDSVFDELERERIPEHATTGQRFANFLLDSVLCCQILLSACLGFIIGLILVAMGVDVLGLLDSTLSERLFSYLIAIIAIFLFYTIFEGASKGRSLGKLITKTVAIREDGNPITWKDAALRSLCRLVPFEVFSGLSGYPWHDKWTKTMVVKKKSM